MSARRSRPKRGRMPLSRCVPRSVSPWDTRSRPLGGCESRGHARARLRVDTCFHPPGPIAGAEAPGHTAALSLAEDLPAWPLQQLHGVARPPAVHGRSGLSASGPVLVT